MVLAPSRDMSLALPLLSQTVCVRQHVGDGDASAAALDSACMFRLVNTLFVLS